jgi:hypothetical protein
MYAYNFMSTTIQNVAQNIMRMNVQIFTFKVLQDVCKYLNVEVYISKENL